MKKIAALLSLIFFLFVTKSSADAAIGYCNFSPEGANGQPYGDVTINSNCVIYESVNGTSLGNLTLQNSIITLHSTLVFSPGKQISIGQNSIIYVNTGGKITQSGLCIKDADGDGYADVITLNEDPESGVTLTNPITQIGKVEANANGSCPSGYVPSDINVQNLTMVDADPLTPSATTIATADRELLRLGFMINGVKDVFAGTGDIQVVNKNLLVCNGLSCPADNFASLTPATGNVYVGGKVGIGTTNPTSALSIAGNIYSDAYISKIVQERAGYYTTYSELVTSPVGQGASWSVNSTYDPGVGSGVTNSTFKVNAGTYNTGAGMIRFDGNSKYWGAWMSGASGGQGTAVTFTQLANLSTNGSWLSSRGSNLDFYLTSAGNVGIGTTAPGEKLEVEGFIKIPNATNSDNNSPGIVYNSDDDFYDSTRAVYLNSYGYGFKVNTQSGSVGPYISGWGGIDFYAGNAQKMILTQTGEVGIGTTAPGEILEVNGNIRTTPNRSLPNFVLDSITTGDNWTAQGAYISIGEGGALGSAAMHMTYTGDGYGYTGTGTVTAGVPAGGYWRYQYNAQNIYTPGAVTVGSLTSGAGTFSSTVTTTGQMWINNASPTIYFKDTDHRGAMLHNNSNLFYVLRGCEATQSTTWCTVGGVWPFVINLETNAITTGGSITATSDIRLKTNIKPLPENTLDKVKQLRGVYFNWKTEADMGNARQIGVIAQEVEKIFPELVITSPDGYKAVGYDRLGPILIEAIKEQQVEIDSLKSQITDLKNEVDQIKQLLKMPR
ncbi:MAG: tail fiber domain-containing protein [Microgenomates group bacterium]